MKKISILMFALLASLLGTTPALAIDACVAIVPAGTPLFIVRGFTPKCSTNVTAQYLENAVAVAVGAVSSKGKSRFQGTSGGGTINGEACAAVTCDATASGDAVTGLQAKLDLAT